MGERRYVPVLKLETGANQNDDEILRELWGRRETDYQNESENGKIEGEREKQSYLTALFSFLPLRNECYLTNWQLRLEARETEPYYNTHTLCVPTPPLSTLPILILLLSLLLNRMIRE